MIGKEANMMAPYAGQMHLCDFGANMEDCPNGPNCRGPGGTEMTFARLYDYTTWSTRVFQQQALKALFPDRLDDIATAADPGEYGLEDYFCRVVCCFIFAMAMMDEFNVTFMLLRLFWKLPTKDETWIKFELPEWDPDKSKAKKMFGWNELNLVKFGVAGMSLQWKLLNICVVFVPKFVILIFLVSLGFYFLLETAGIVDMILNSLAMTFILEMDELIFGVLTTVPVKHMMANLEDYRLFSIEAWDHATEDDSLQQFQEELSGRWSNFFRVLLPRRFITVVAITVIFVLKYYARNCVKNEDGGWVSKPMYATKALSYNPITLLWSVFSHQQDTSSAPYWVMPEKQ
jgi:hypothetical protein